jgi:hypothetical protein
MSAADDVFRTHSHTVPLQLRGRTVATVKISYVALKQALSEKIDAAGLSLGMQVAWTINTHGEETASLPVQLEARDGPVLTERRARRISEPDWVDAKTSQTTAIDVVAHAIRFSINTLSIEDLADDWIAGRQIIDRDDLKLMLQREGLSALRLPLVRRAISAFWAEYTNEDREILIAALFGPPAKEGNKPKQHRNALGVRRFYDAVHDGLEAAAAALRVPRKKYTRAKRAGAADDGRKKTPEDHRLAIGRETERLRTTLLRNHFSTRESRGKANDARKVIDLYLGRRMTRREAAIALTSLRFGHAGVSKTQVRSLIKSDGKSQSIPRTVSSQK